MKKFLLTLTAVAGLTVASQAQEFGFEKGNFIVEGNLGFTNKDVKGEKIKNTTFNFNPQVGYFVTDKIAVGVFAKVGTTNKDQYAEDKDIQNKTNTFDIGAFGRYYFLEVGSRFKTYTELAVGYESDNSKTVTAGTSVKDPKVSGFGANAGIGATFFLTDKIAVNYKFADVIGFKNSKVDVDGAKATNTFGVNVNNFENFFASGTFGLTFKF
ncbi:outer membrane beta-barrel protein [Sphingobacterium paucimobilis]|uniref:Outer membrane protein beta-barrel domain-containing protein n=1 Tax=Sphingobacterium paucimobilis HER1398 TaxID=1346330 RepID=U2J7D7_9SPHI|nr:outer membrane beta-barrel protein [Sphingobacterium paucimobilis]ERJ60844.1 hypothetical protein M472_18995 [Sphingobacterium paucimobilis HER1398]